MGLIASLKDRILGRRLMARTNPNYNLVHGGMKAIIVGATGLAANQVRHVYEHKRKHGFVQKPVAVIDTIFDEMMALDEPIRAEGYDYIREFYSHFRILMTVGLDEDTHYLKRFLLFQELMWRHRDEMREALEASNRLFEWQKVWAEIVEWEKNGIPPTASHINKMGQDVKLPDGSVHVIPPEELVK